MINQWNKWNVHKSSSRNIAVLSGRSGISKIPIIESSRSPITDQDFQFCFHSYRDIEGIHRTIQMSLREIKSAIKAYNNGAYRTKINPATGINRITPISFRRIQGISGGQSSSIITNPIGPNKLFSSVSPLPPVSQYNSINQFIHSHSIKLSDLSPVQILELFMDQYSSVGWLEYPPVPIISLDRYINNETIDNPGTPVPSPNGQIIDSLQQSISNDQTVPEDYQALSDIFQ